MSTREPRILQPNDEEDLPFCFQVSYAVLAALCTEGKVNPDGISDSDDVWPALLKSSFFSSHLISCHRAGGQSSLKVSSSKKEYVVEFSQHLNFSSMQTFLSDLGFKVDECR